MLKQTRQSRRQIPRTTQVLPKYRSYKLVEALKIRRISREVPSVVAPANTHLITPEHGFDAFYVSDAYMEKHEPRVGGYWVRYADGYESYSPAAAFESGYTAVVSADIRFGLNFGQALEALKAGFRAYREGWNGKDMWLAYSPGTSALPAHKFWAGPNREFALDNGGSAPVLPCITMKTATGEILMGWLASQTDMLAEDWCVR